MTALHEAPATVLRCRPRFEGANIRTWIGFKHFLYLVEEGVLGWFRDRGLGPQELYHRHGLGVEIVDCSAQLPAVLEVDDEVRAEVEHAGGRRFAVRLVAVRDGGETLVLKAKVTVALVSERDGEAASDAIAGFVTGTVGAGSTVTAPADRECPGDPVDLLSADGGFVWAWRARYFHCHYADRVQHSGYVRALEEVVDRFLADRGISVGTLMRERAWIPVVSRARVRLVTSALLEEVVYTTFEVGDVLRDTLFDGRMDCYVLRDGRLLHTATASIVHGYAIGAGERAGELAHLDHEVVAALTGASR
ncbi:thioesterase [Amycolatopsis minnesotensis]|uniref:Thioesterase-like superfamily protein n=1 Tax=Amycolatopsis minnesotensis TaxID=337894 RepID=A0ABN2QPJ7_9PSEU